MAEAVRGIIRQQLLEVGMMASGGGEFGLCPWVTMGGCGTGEHGDGQGDDAVGSDRAVRRYDRGSAAGVMRRGG